MKNLFITSVFLLALISCKPKPVGYCIIPRETFRDMLVEVHIADGMYGSDYGKYKHNDSLNFYQDIFRKYGYSRACFDSTFKFYMRNAKEFDLLYDDVLTDLNKTQQEIFRLQPFDDDTASNLIKHKVSWNLPLDGRFNKIPFDIRLTKKDTVNFSIMVFLAFQDYDGCKHPRLTAYYWKDDGTKKGKRQYFPVTPYRKTKRYVLYRADCKPNDSTYTNLRGFAIDSDNDDDFRHLHLKKFIILR